MVTQSWEDVLKNGAEEKQKKVEAEKKKEEVDKLEGLEKKDKLIFVARDILGEYLAGQVYPQVIQQAPALNSFLRRFGPYILAFQRNNNGYGAQFSSQWTNCNSDLVNKLLSEASDGFSAKTDLLKGAQQRSDPSLIFPEYLPVDKLIKGMNFTFSSPLGVVMMMAPDYRPIMAVAAKRFLDKNKIQIQDGVKKLQYAPDLVTLLEVAKEYDCTDLKTSVQQFNSCLSQAD